MGSVGTLTVLITGAGTATCQSVIKGLRGQTQVAVRIVTVDMQADSAGRYMSDAFHTVPRADDPTFIERLLEICKRERVSLLIPIVDYEFARVACYKQRFAEIGCTVAISDLEVIEQCTDKWKTFRFFSQHGFRTAQCFPLEDCKNLEIARSLPFPLFLKPRYFGRASLGTAVVHDVAELQRELVRGDEPLICELLHGVEYTVDVLCDFSGHAINGVVRERSETKAGVSYKGVTIADSQILSEAVRIAETLGVVGHANIQCFKNEHGTFFFEVNPRYSGALALSLAAGFNSPGLLVRMATGEVIEPHVGHYEAGVRMLRYWQEVFVSSSGSRLPSLSPFAP